MKTIEDLISYPDDSTSAYVFESEIDAFAAEIGKDPNIVLEEIEQELFDYDLVEIESIVGRIIFHKKENL